MDYTEMKQSKVSIATFHNTEFVYTVKSIYTVLQLSSLSIEPEGEKLCNMAGTQLLYTRSYWQFIIIFRIAVLHT